ncbi:MAG: ABC transporter permease subunit [Nocardioidaceae bacterium]
MSADSTVKWLSDSRRALLGWTIAIVGVAAMYASLWHQVVNDQMRQVLRGYPKGLLEALGYQNLTVASYLTAQVYGLLGAVLMLILAISQGTRMVAGDEEAGTLGLVLAHPVSRWSLALQRYAALLLALAGICAALLLVMAAIAGLTGAHGVSLAGFTAMSVHMWLFGALFGAFSFATGAATGRRTAAIVAGAGLAVLAFAANGVLPQVQGLGWTQRLSPFHWLIGGSPLEHGLQGGHLLVMAALTVALVAAGLYAFDRRDLRT